MPIAAIVLIGEMMIVWLLPDPARGVVSLVLLTAAVTALLMAGSTRVGERGGVVAAVRELGLLHEYASFAGVTRGQC